MERGTHPCTRGAAGAFNALQEIHDNGGHNPRAHRGSPGHHSPHTYSHSRQSRGAALTLGPLCSILARIPSIPLAGMAQWSEALQCCSPTAKHHIITSWLLPSHPSLPLLQAPHPPVGQRGDIRAGTDLLAGKGEGTAYSSSWESRGALKEKRGNVLMGPGVCWRGGAELAPGWVSLTGSPRSPLVPGAPGMPCGEGWVRRGKGYPGGGVPRGWCYSWDKGVPMGTHVLALTFLPSGPGSPSSPFSPGGPRYPGSPWHGEMCFTLGHSRPPGSRPAQGPHQPSTYPWAPVSRFARHACFTLRDRWSEWAGGQHGDSAPQGSHLPGCLHHPSLHAHPIAQVRGQENKSPVSLCAAPHSLGPQHPHSIFHCPRPHATSLPRCPGCPGAPTLPGSPFSPGSPASPWGGKSQGGDQGEKGSVAHDGWTDGQRSEASCNAVTLGPLLPVRPVMPWEVQKDSPR